MVLCATPRNLAACPSVSQSLSPEAARREPGSRVATPANLPKGARSLHLRSHGRGGVSARNVERSVDSDRLAGLRVVVQCLSERDPEEEDQEHDEGPDAPADAAADRLRAARVMRLRSGDSPAPTHAARRRERSSRAEDRIRYVPEQTSGQGGSSSARIRSPSSYPGRASAKAT